MRDHLGGRLLLAALASVEVQTSSRNRLALALLPRVCAAIKTAKPARRDHGRARAGQPMRRALAVRRLLTPPSGGAGSAAVLPAFRSSEGDARSRLACAGSAAGFRSRHVGSPEAGAPPPSVGAIRRQPDRWIAAAGEAGEGRAATAPPPRAAACVYSWDGRRPDAYRHGRSDWSSWATLIRC